MTASVVLLITLRIFTASRCAYLLLFESTFVARKKSLCAIAPEGFFNGRHTCRQLPDEET